MCGRTACTYTDQVLCNKCLLNLKSSKLNFSPTCVQESSSKGKYHPSYNQAPGSFSPVLVFDRQLDAVVLQPMRWGLIPSFAQNDSGSGFATSNARIESLLQKSTYGASMREGKRCVVVAQGFYEWKSELRGKQPYYICPSDPEKLMMMAGVYAYNHWKQLNSYAVITTESAGVVSTIHHRMPVILESDDDVATWLNSTEISATEAYTFLLKLTKDLKMAPLTMYPVTPRMNSTTYDKPDCIIPLDELKKSPATITSFFKPTCKRDDMENKSESKAKEHYPTKKLKKESD